MDHSLDIPPAGSISEARQELLQSKAAEGDAEAQFGLGLHYGTGVGEALDFIQAAVWYRKAAEQNHPLAQYNLGVMFALGQGLARDDVAAEEWTHKAAEGGDAGGQYDLGVRCHRASLNPLSRGAAESRIEAYKWFQLAAAQGYRDSITAYQRLSLKMSRAEVDEGSRRAAAFVLRKPATVQAPDSSL